MSKQTLYIASRPYRPAALVAPFVTGWRYRLGRLVLGLGVAGGLVGGLMTAGPGMVMAGSVDWLSAPLSLYAGLFLLAGAGHLLLTILRLYFNSYYFAGLDMLLQVDRATDGIVYEVAAIALEAPADVTAGYLHSQFGRTVLARVGIEPGTLSEFLASERPRLLAASLTFPESAQGTLLALTELIVDSDAAFTAWLETQGVRADDVLGAAAWTHREHVLRKRRARWWSRDQLSQKAGIGRDFIYGVPYTLNTYSKPLALGAVYHNVAKEASVHPQLVRAVEEQLVQPGAGNVLLVGEPGVGKLDIVLLVSERLASGQALGSITNPQLRLLDTERLVASASEKGVFERTLLKLLNEAAGAGNVIIVIDDLPGFITSAASYGVDVGTLLDEYLGSTALRVIATSTTAAYHEALETNAQLLRYFMVAQVAPADTEATRAILEDLATTYQRETGVHTTYQALNRIATDADRYVVNGVMPDKAIHLFEEIVTAVGSSGQRMVTVADIDSYVADSTGIPVGPMNEEERALLLDLETVLHSRIVGQDVAVAAISSVMRRARADIQASDKPLGSFLCMGPTGVGKTESAKALAAVFFKREDAMHRFDMTEYSGADALAKLIGTPTSAGTLSSALREQPYAVVLLDEFEKAAESVHDVFLQILDEGQFTDGRGQRINARNTIIVATSNAGSDKILQWLEAGEDLHNKKSDLVAYVIQSGVYKPELINRFDDVVLFTPLKESEQRQIAKQLLQELATRIEDKGYRLAVTDELIDTVARLGYDADFGARPMRRTIQTVVEDIIAKKVIAGTLKPGETITFTSAELAAFRSQ